MHVRPIIEKHYVSILYETKFNKNKNLSAYSFDGPALRSPQGEAGSIKNNKLCKTKPISEKPKMNLYSYTTKTYDNKSGLLTMEKQTPSKPICSELAEPMDYIYTIDETKKSV